MEAPKVDSDGVDLAAAVTGPLAGVRVIDASTILAGPMTCQVLGDFGADVIKVEHPDMPDGLRGHGVSVDGEGLWWKEVGRNKRTVALRLSDEDGAQRVPRADHRHRRPGRELPSRDPRALGARTR